MNSSNNGFHDGSGSQRPAQVRVARVIDRLNVGGPSKHVVWLSAGLNSMSFQTMLITGTVPAGEGDMSYFALDQNITPEIIPEMSRELSWRDVLVVVKLLRLFLRFKPDIVHTHKAKAGAVGRTAAGLYRWLTVSSLWLKPRKCIVVHTYHGHIFHSYYSTSKTRLFLMIERTLAKLFTNRIITISPQQRDEIVNRFRVGTLAGSTVIPLGLDLGTVSDANNQLKDEFNFRKDIPLVGIVGRLCEIKNHALLIETAAILKRDNCRVQFAILGDGHLRPQLETQVQELGIQDMVTFTGFRRDMTTLYAGLDLVALTSLNEGTPLTLIEALASGRAVASTEVGGVVDIMGEFREQRNGFKIWDHGVTSPSGDAESFAKAVRFLIDTPDLRSEMGRRGQRFVQDQYSKDRLVQNIAHLYRDLIAQT